MRAVVITTPGGPEVLQVQDVPLPEPVGSQVRVRVLASGVNRADLAQRAGNYPAPADAPRNIPGLEFAGVVDAVGSLAQQWSVGQRVMGLTGGGGQAEYVVVHEGLLVEIPQNLDFVQAAGIPEAFMTAHDGLFTQGELGVGERVLIHAVGSGVGTAAVQLAHAAGAIVFGTSRVPEKLERSKELGLDHGVPAEDFGAAVKRLTNGEGVHLVLDFIGAPYLSGNLEALSVWGRLVFLSTLGGSQATVSIGWLMQKRIMMRGVTLRTRTLSEKLVVVQRFAVHVLPLLASGQVTPVIERVFAMDEVALAHRAMDEGQHFGKLIIRMQ